MSKINSSNNADFLCTSVGLQEHNSQFIVTKVRVVGDFINKENPELKWLPLHLSHLYIFNS